MAGVPWHQRGQAGGVTQVQSRYLRAMGSFAEEEGRLPTSRELAVRMGVSAMTAYRAMSLLKGKGFLWSRPRGLMSLTAKGQQALGVSE